LAKRRNKQTQTSNQRVDEGDKERCETDENSKANETSDGTEARYDDTDRLGQTLKVQITKRVPHKQARTSESPKEGSASRTTTTDQTHRTKPRKK